MLWKLDLSTESVDCIHIGRGHERSVECIGVDSNASFLATGGWDTMLKIWAASEYLDEYLLYSIYTNWPASIALDESKTDEGDEKEATKKKSKTDGKSLTRVSHLNFETALVYFFLIAAVAF